MDFCSIFTIARVDVGSVKQKGEKCEGYYYLKCFLIDHVFNQTLSIYVPGNPCCLHLLATLVPFNYQVLLITCNIASPVGLHTNCLRLINFIIFLTKLWVYLLTWAKIHQALLSQFSLLVEFFIGKVTVND